MATLAAASIFRTLTLSLDFRMTYDDNMCLTSETVNIFEKEANEKSFFLLLAQYICTSFQQSFHFLLFFTSGPQEDDPTAAFGLPFSQRHPQLPLVCGKGPVAMSAAFSRASKIDDLKAGYAQRWRLWRSCWRRFLVMEVYF